MYAPTMWGCPKLPSRRRGFRMTIHSGGFLVWTLTAPCSRWLFRAGHSGHWGSKYRMQALNRCTQMGLGRSPSSQTSPQTSTSPRAPGRPQNPSTGATNQQKLKCSNAANPNCGDLVAKIRNIIGTRRSRAVGTGSAINQRSWSHTEWLVLLSPTDQRDRRSASNLGLCRCVHDCARCQL